MSTKVTALVVSVLIAIALVPGCRDRDPEFALDEPELEQPLLEETEPVYDPADEGESPDEATDDSGDTATEPSADEAVTRDAPAESRTERTREAPRETPPSPEGSSAPAPRETPPARSGVEEPPREPRTRPEGDGGPPRDDQERRERGDIFDRFDTNRDGVLTADEIPEPMRERVMRMDADGDGRVTREEFEAFRQQLREAGERWGRGEGADRPDRGERGEAFQRGERGELRERRDPAERARELFDQLDVNQDGKLTADELPEHLREVFKQAVGGDNGAVTREEFEEILRSVAPRGPRQSENQ